MSDRDWDIGDRPRVRVEFVDLSDVLGDPQAVTVTVKLPGGTATTITATHVSTGIYDAYVSLSTSGLWAVRAAGTGGLQAAAEAVLTVRRSEVI